MFWNIYFFGTVLTSSTPCSFSTFLMEKRLGRRIYVVSVLCLPHFCYFSIQSFYTAITYHIIQNSFMPFRCSSKLIFEYIATPQLYLSALLFEATQCFKNSFRVLSRKELTIKRSIECRSNAH
jgi:hypothetical protein